MASSASLDELQKKFEENKRRYLAPLANEYRKAGDLDSAIDLCRAYLPEYPEHLSGYVVFGQALYEAGQLDEASTAFTTALALDPENLIALRHLGDIARDGGDREGARDWYQRVLDADPRNESVATALQSLDSMPVGAPIARSTPTPTNAPALDYGMLHSTGAASLTPPTLGALDDRRTPHVPNEAVATVDSSTSSRTEAAPDDAVDFDPGFFADADVPQPERQPALDLLEIDDQAVDDRQDEEARAEPGAHEIEPSELALAAELDVPLVDDPILPAFDADSAFDFQTTAPEPELEIERAQEFDGREATTGEEAPSLERDGAMLDEAPSMPEPAYGGGFDANDFFVDEPEVEPDAVSPPANVGLESMELGAPPHETASASGDPEAPFVTETMAELYLQQGFRSDALQVYEQLLEASPNDDALRERVMELRADAPSSLGFTDTHAAVDAAEPLAADAPSALSNGGTERPSAREFFATLARRGSDDGDHQGPPDGGAPGGTDPYGAVDGEHGANSASHDDSRSSSHAESHSGSSLDALFGAASNGEDEHAASTLASLLGDGSLHGQREPAAVAAAPFTPNGDAFATSQTRTMTPPSVPQVDVASAPSRPADRELSLDDVFGAPRPPARATPNSSFSFDQFFADAQPAPEAAPPVAASAPSSAAPADEASDLEQFNAWLEGLKKR